MRPPAIPADPRTWRAWANPTSTPRPRRTAAGDVPGDGDVVNLVIDRGLRGDRLDFMHLTPDEAIDLATPVEQSSTVILMTSAAAIASSPSALDAWDVAYDAAEAAVKAARARGDYGSTSMYHAIATSGITRAEADDVTDSVMRALFAGNDLVEMIAEGVL